MEKIKSWLRRFILWTAYASVSSAPEKKQRENKKKLLIVRIDAIGDFMMFSSLLPYYRELFKDYEITLFANKVNGSLVERLQTNHTIDNLILFDRKKSSRSILYNKTLFKTIRDSVFDAVVYPAFSREFVGDYIVAISGAPMRVGYDGDYRNISRRAREKTGAYYTNLIPASSGIMPEPKRNKEFVEQLATRLGLKLHIDNYLPVFKPSADELKTAETLLNETGFDSTKKYMIVCTGSSNSQRNWSVEKFAEVLIHLHRAYGLEVIIGGSTQETATAKILQELLPFPVIDLTGKTPLPVFGAICTKTELYLGNDTGTTHIAAAVGLPIVCIMGGGIGRFFPYGDPATHVAVYDTAQYARAIAGDPELRYQLMHGTENNVTVAQVLAAVQEVLKDKPYATR